MPTVLEHPIRRPPPPRNPGLAEDLSSLCSLRAGSPAVRVAVARIAYRRGRATRGRLLWPGRPWRAPTSGPRPTAAVYQVGTGTFSQLRSLDALPANLPLQLTSFVGARARAWRARRCAAVEAETPVAESRLAGAKELSEGDPYARMRLLTCVPHLTQPSPVVLGSRR